MFWAWMLALIRHGEEHISKEENGRDRFMDVGQKRMCGLKQLHLDIGDINLYEL